MTGCILTHGISKGCRDNAGGIVEVYLANHPSGTTWYDESDISGGTVDTIDLAGEFYVFVPNKISSNWEENIVASLENGTIGYEPSINLVFAKNDADKRNIIKILGEASLVAIVRDKNEKYWLVGPQNGLEISEGNSNSGINLNDLNGWTITLMGHEKHPAMEVDPSIISALLA